MQYHSRCYFSLWLNKHRESAAAFSLQAQRAMDYLTSEGWISLFPTRLDTFLAFDTCYHRRTNKRLVACLAEAKPRAKSAVIFLDVCWQLLTLAGLACLICSLCGFQSDNRMKMTGLWFIPKGSLF